MPPSPVAGAAPPSPSAAGAAPPSPSSSVAGAPSSSGRKRPRALSATYVWSAYQSLSKEVEALGFNIEETVSRLRTAAVKLSMCPRCIPFTELEDFVQLRLMLIRRLLLNTLDDDVLHSLTAPEKSLVTEIRATSLSTLEALHHRIMEMLAVVNEDQLINAKANMQLRLKAAAEVNTNSRRMADIAHSVANNENLALDDTGDEDGSVVEVAHGAPEAGSLEASSADGASGRDD